MQVVRIIDNEAVPLLKRCSLAGHATLKSPARVFSDHPLAADMCIDILSDRGAPHITKPSKTAPACHHNHFLCTGIPSASIPTFVQVLVAIGPKGSILS